MTDQQIQQTICKSVFKSGKNTTKAQYTKKWIELINHLEKSKGVRKSSDKPLPI